MWLARSPLICSLVHVRYQFFSSYYDHPIHSSIGYEPCALQLARSFHSFCMSSKPNTRSNSSSTSRSSNMTPSNATGSTDTGNSKGYTIIKLRDEDKLRATGANFSSWSKLVEILFKANDLLPLVNGDEQKPDVEDAKYPDWIRRDARSLIAINIEMSLMAALPTNNSSALWKASVSFGFSRSDSVWLRFGYGFQTEPKPVHHWASVWFQTGLEPV